MGKRYCLLFVDDEERVLRSLNSIFRRDYDVYFASNEREALDILSQQAVDVIVCDQYMPTMTGRELLSLVYDQYPAVVRILLVGCLDKKITLSLVNQGEIFDCIGKPWNTEEIKKIIASAAESSRYPVLDHTPIVSPSNKLRLKPALAKKEQIDESPVDEPPVAKSVLDEVVVSTLPAMKARPLKFTSEVKLDVRRRLTSEVEQKTAILLMDKDYRVRNSIRAMSRRFGFEVYGASSYTQAISTFAIRPDIGVAIINITGDLTETLEALHLFKQYCPDLSVIALAQVSDANIAIQLINEGQVFRYLQKPIEPKEFESAVVAGIKRHRMLKKVGALGDHYREEDKTIPTKSGMQKLKELFKFTA